tara:strand:+ start:603 stop:773 length:171 start_codon:yes stop_codon:yes gene_type:complete
MVASMAWSVDDGGGAGGGAGLVLPVISKPLQNRRSDERSDPNFAVMLQCVARHALT